MFDPDQRFPSVGDQHADDEIVPAVTAARRIYRDHPSILAGVEACVRESEWDTSYGL